MKSFVVVIITAAALAATLPVSAADVGVSVQISQPGVYGRIDIGRFPQPQVVLAQPVIIYRPVEVQPVQPVYLWVPPGHRRQWRRYCSEYDACGVPVYFVQDGWYQRQVQPHVHEDRYERGDEHREYREYRERRERGDDEHGRGRGHGKKDD